MTNSITEVSRSGPPTPRPGVLVLVSSLSFGGAEKHAISLANNLDVARFRLFLCHIKREDTLLRELDRSRVEASFSLSAKKGMDTGAVRALAERIERHRIDVIIATNGFSVIYALAAAALVARRPKIVGVFHTTQVAGLKSQVRMALHKLAFRRCDLLVYVSAAQQKWWEQRGLRSRREVVIHNGINVEYFTGSASAADRARVRADLGLTAQDYVVGICAALRPEKAHVDLARAIAILRRTDPAVKLMIIGDGPERPTIERSIQSLGLQGSAVITGFQADVRVFIESCDVMVLCSHAVETFSIAALEAMALSKPLVLTRIGGAEEQVMPGVNGFLFEPGDVDALAAHLRTLSDAGQRAQMGKCSAQLVRQQFTVQRMAHAFGEEIQRLIMPAARVDEPLVASRLAK